MVLLPAPFSPTRACTSPGSAEKDALWSACTPPNDFEMSLPSMLVMSIAPTRFSFAYGLSGCHCQDLMSSFGGGKEGQVVRYLCCGTDTHHLLLVRYGSFTFMPSGQT